MFFWSERAFHNPFCPTTQLYLVQGDFVYASSRGSGVLLVYRIQESGGRLQRLQEVKLEGSWPRSLAIRWEEGGRNLSQN